MALSFSVFLFALLKLYFRTLMSVYCINFQFRGSGVGLANSVLLLLGGAPPRITVVSTFGFSGSLPTYIYQ